MKGGIQVRSKKHKKRRYPRQDDPTDSTVPLAWIFHDGSKRVGKTPPKQYGIYRKVVIGEVIWFVHCSFAGALKFVFEALGEGNVEIDEDSGTGELVVPEDMIGSWIGKNGCVAGFLKAMFGLGYIQITGHSNWQFR